MGFNAIWRPHAISFPTTPTPTYLTQFTDIRQNRAVDEYTERSASEASPQQSGGMGASPMVEFETNDLKSVIDLCTIVGVVGDFGTGTTALYYRKSKNRNFREDVSATVHDRYDMVNNSMLVWTRVGAEQRQAAQISAMVKAASSDGLARPIVGVGSVALAGVSAVNNRFTLGPVALNGVTIDSVQSVSLDNRLTFDDEDESGATYPQYNGVNEWNPRLEILTNDETVFRTYPETGTPLTALNGYFRRMPNTRVGPDVPTNATHIKYTGAAGTIFATEVSGLRAAARIVVLINKPDAATPPLVFNTASDIT